nr:PAS domain S-box protein [Desulfobacula sp.]
MSIDLICIADIRTTSFIKVNPAFKETLGYTEEELLGESFLHFIHPDDIDPTRAVVEKKLQQGEKVINFENRYRCKDGSYKWLSWVSHPRPERGLTYALARDITGRKQTEARLIGQEAVQRLLIKLSTDFINVPLNRIEGAIHDLLEILGKFAGMNRVYISRHDLGRCISIITNEWCAKGISSAMDRTREIPFDLLADIVEVHKKGRPFHLPNVMEMPEAHSLRSYLQDRGVQSMLAIPLMQEGFCIGFLGMDAVGKIQVFDDMNIIPLTLAAGIVTNITARQRAEEILRESEGKYRLLVENTNELILVAQDGLIRFVNGKSSDFLGYRPDELTDNPFSDFIHPEDRKMVLERHLKRLKGEILPGVYPFRVVHRTGDERWVEVNAVMIQWEGKPAGNLWPVKMDPSQIDQILANLCVNARDAITGVGKLTIETGMKTFDREYCREHAGFVPGDFVLLAVSDDGCGMDRQTMDKLFEPFFTTKEVGKGTGLGLATIYGIVKQNNGFINVYSEPGQGTTFRIYIPRSQPEVDAPKIQPSAVSIPGGSETILLVEDEAAILKMTRMMLERKGCTVLPAGSPTEAMTLAQAHEGVIHLLITDVVMPEMNGRDLAGRLTSLYPNLKLLFMSGYTANVIAHQGILDKGVSFIQKPFSMADLVLQVRGCWMKGNPDHMQFFTREGKINDAVIEKMLSACHSGFQAGMSRRYGHILDAGTGKAEVFNLC